MKKEVNHDDICMFYNIVQEDFCELEQRDIDEQSQIHIRKREVKKLLNELKTCKSPGPDGLHPRLLHELANEIYITIKHNP